RLIRCVCGKKIGPDPRNFNQRVSLGRNDLLIRTFPNSAEKIRWSTDEMQPDKGLEMTVALRETDAGQGVPGNFRALATFNFIYQ
ncbi:fimbrial protein, partial [Escherichia coli]|uniref:fimbrial protein n=4 Tax=Escherichia coli TaxID=562 RepID=UPI00208E09D9